MTVGILLFGFVMAPMFEAGTTGAVVAMAVGLALMGLTYGPLGTVLSELVSDVRALHGKLADLQLRGDLRSLTGPYIATWLANRAACSPSAITFRRQPV